MAVFYPLRFSKFTARKKLCYKLGMGTLQDQTYIQPETFAGSGRATVSFPVVPMRRPKSRRQKSSASADSASIAESLPPLGVIALNRMGFGPRPGDVDDFLALGTNDQARLEAYVELQLHPESIDDTGLEDRLAAA